MTLAYTASQSCGSDYYFHSSMSVSTSNSAMSANSSQGMARDARKRSYNEAMNAGKMAVDDSQNQEARKSNDSFWSKVDEIGSRVSQFNRGKLIRVD